MEFSEGNSYFDLNLFLSFPLTFPEQDRSGVRGGSSQELTTAVLQIRIQQNYRIQHSASGYIPKELKAGTQRDICIPMFTAALFTVAEKCKQPKYSSRDEWMNKL